MHALMRAHKGTGTCMICETIAFKHDLIQHAHKNWPNPLVKQCRFVACFHS